MTESTGTENKATKSADLSFLKEVSDVPATLQPVKRGRQPGSNPMDGKVKAAFDAGSPRAVSVPAKHARQTERITRRSALRQGYSISIQVLRAEPGKATADDVVTLSEIENLPPDMDVWVTYEVTAKTPKVAKSDATDDAESGTDGGSDAAPADPFKGQPDAAPAVKATGRKTGKVPAVANP